MKHKIPAKVVEVCDICHNEGFLEKCTACKGQYCIVHEGTIPRSWGFTSVCRNCASRKDVQKICEQYSKKLTPIYKNRQKALARLPKKLKDPL